MGSLVKLRLEKVRSIIKHLNISSPQDLIISFLCRSLWVLLSFFFWPLRCHSYVWLLITPLVSSDYPFGVFKLSIIPQANTKIFDTCWIIISYYIFRHFLFSSPPYLDVFNGYDYMSQILLATLEKRFSRIWWRRKWT